MNEASGRDPETDGGRERDAQELDARGLLCPLPVLKARKALSALPSGAVLAVVADDPAAIVDIPHFCAEQGHIYLGVEPADAEAGATSAAVTPAAQRHRIRKA